MIISDTVKSPYLYIQDSQSEFCIFTVQNNNKNLFQSVLFISTFNSKNVHSYKKTDLNQQMDITRRCYFEDTMQEYKKFYRDLQQKSSKTKIINFFKRSQQIKCLGKKASMISKPSFL